MQRIVFLIPHFGPWPEWINHFIESCRANKTIDWILFSDAPPPDNRARNVRHVSIGFGDYCRLVSQRLQIDFRPGQPYKLCDVKPANAHIHADLVRGYDFVGFGDLDVIYGDLRSFLDPETLDGYDVFSTHANRISGHLCLLRNEPEIVTLFKRARDWQAAMLAPDYAEFDEGSFYRLFRPGRGDLLARWQGSPCRILLREAYSTPTGLAPMAWYWQDGRLTNAFYPQHPHMYLHFMIWHSNRWYGGQSGIAPGTPAPWRRLDTIVGADWRQARKRGFMISPDGIQDIVTPRYG